MYVCYNQRTWSLWHDLCDINAHLIFPPFPILYWNCFTISIKRNKVKVILGCRKPSTFLFWSQQWDINASRLTHSWPSPNADCIDSLNSRLPHYNISQSSVICSVVSYRWSSIYYHTSIFSDQENLSFAAVCLFFPFSFLLHLPNVPLWKTQAINCAIKTHGHNFLTLLPPLSLYHWHTHARLFFCLIAPLHLDLLCQSLWLKWTLNGSKRPLARFRTYHHPSLQPPHY